MNTVARPHPALAIGRCALLGLPGNSDEASLWRLLSHRVMREPGRLVDHARRIRLCDSELLGERCAGALADLYWVLDGRGAPLAQRLLEHSAGRLEKGQIRLLLNAMGGDRSAHLALRDWRWRVLPGINDRLQHAHRTLAS